MLENIAGVADALKMGTKVTNILDRLTTDTHIKEEFQKNGKIDGTFTLSHYRINFTVYDMDNVVDVTPAEPEKPTE